jgi:hypothetical protein
MRNSDDIHRAAARARLRIEFGPVVNDDAIDVVVDESFAARATARIHQFIPVLAEREARERLRQLARTGR